MPTNEPKLLDQARALIRTMHYSIRTEEAYVDWMRRFILFHNKRHPSQMGKAEIEAFLATVVPTKGNGPQRKHYICNTVIEVAGNEASAVSDYLIIRESDAGLIPVMGGTYKDNFRQVSGRWLFSRKFLVHDIAGDMGLLNNR